MENKKRWGYFGIAVLITALLVLFDQFTKIMATRHLMNQEDILLIPGVFSLRYLENRGMAFGMLQGARIFFFIITIVIAGVMTYVFFKIPTEKKYRPLRIIYTVLLAGAMGNFIDRTFHGFVVDFLYFQLIDFPIFNVADCYVTLACIALFICILFVYKDEDFEKIFPKKKKGAHGKNQS